MDDYKETFFEKVQPYVDEKIVREVYSSENFVVFNLGELVYLVCPYVSLNQEEPFGILMPVDLIKEIITDENKFYLLIQTIIKENKFNERAIPLTESNLNNIKSFIKQEFYRGAPISVDYDFENKLKLLMKKVTGK